MMKKPVSSRLAKALLLPPLCGVLNSCVAVGVVGPHRESHTQFKLPDPKEKADPGRRLLESSHHGRNPSRKELVAAWGQPDEKKRPAADGTETWTWQRPHVAWTGFYSILLVVPIPIALPLSSQLTEVKFSPGNDSSPALEWTDQRQGDAYFGVGISPDIDGDDPQWGPFFGGSDFSQRRTPGL